MNSTSTRSTLLFLFAFFFVIGNIMAQTNKPNYDESKVPGFSLPTPVKSFKGKTILTKEAWEEYRKPELLESFANEMFGNVPGKLERIRVKQTSPTQLAINGSAHRKEITVYFSGRTTGPKMTILLYLPAERRGQVPIFLGYNFYGNHTIHDDPGISITDSWVMNNASFGITQNQATEASRGVRASRWSVEMILERGYGLATIYYGDVDPDFDDGFENGVHQLFPENRDGASWGSIATWAWGLSQAMDYLETDPDVDDDRVVVLGHSRLGKTALWAGATDERYAAVISNNSGCGGAAISRRKFGETIAVINKNFPHWFCDNFKKYNDNEDALPFDQHLLISLIAPRPVYVASASEDQWADPKGEFLAAKGAEKVYSFYGLEGLPINEMPEVNEPAMGTIGYHLRKGKHDLTEFDWTQYLNFADKHLK